MFPRVPVAIDQIQRAGEFSKARHSQYQFPAQLALNGGDPANQIAFFIPSLQLCARAPRFQHEIFRTDREPFLTRLAEHGILARVEEALDGPNNIDPR